MSEFLRVENLRKVYSTASFAHKSNLRALDGVSFALEKGEVLSVVGESGCGKSTLAKLILKIERPTSGAIYFKGEDIFNQDKWSDKRRYWQSVKMIFQDPYSSLNPRWRIGKTLAEPLILTKRYKNSNITSIIEEKLEEVGLKAEDANKFPHEFSGGQRQRIAILRSIISNPELIICDEPTSALDVSVRAQIINLLIGLQKKYGLTYIFISHDLSVVNYISDRVMVIYRGKIMEILPAENMFTNAVHPYSKALIEAMPDLDKKNIKKSLPLKGELTVADRIIKGCVFQDRCLFAKGDCIKVDMSLVKVGQAHYTACPFFQ
jgi:oligopeptide/dipeptide ABC transporter ATP-binding protein